MSFCVLEYVDEFDSQDVMVLKRRNPFERDQYLYRNWIKAIKKRKGWTTWTNLINTFTNGVNPSVSN